MDRADHPSAHHSHRNKLLELETTSVRELASPYRASIGQKQTMEALANSAFTTSGALMDCVDKKMVLVLRDNTKLIGVLRSFDQYGNLVLQDSIERIHVQECYADIPKGVYLIRGENVVLMGEIVCFLVVPLISGPG